MLYRLYMTCQTVALTTTRYTRMGNPLYHVPGYDAMPCHAKPNRSCQTTREALRQVPGVTRLPAVECMLLRRCKETYLAQISCYTHPKGIFQGCFP